MNNISSILTILAVAGLGVLKSQSGSQSGRDFKKFLKAIKESKQAQQAELEFVDESKHYKFNCKSLIEEEFGQKKVIVFSKTTSDKNRAAKNRKTSLKKACGIDDIDEKHFRF